MAGEDVSQKAVAPYGKNGADLPDGNIDKIRDILFGAQSRELDKRLLRLEERLAKETAAIRDDMRRRLEALEQFVKSETETLTQRLKTEQQERGEASKDVQRELRDATKALEGRLGQLDEATAKAHRDLRQQLLDQSKTLTDDVRAKYEDLSHLLESEIHVVRTDKADRASLADLLTEMAVRLTNDFKLPRVD